jgi:tRNA pseudouridine55 synthase
MEGFLLVDKSADWTSHDVVAKLRGITGVTKIGHAGTLDPFATGLLVVGVGRGATKRLAEIAGTEKTYEAVAMLGATSDTQDLTGKISPVEGVSLPDETMLRATMATFTGMIAQVPPMYSAKKVGGKKLYELARKGVEIERKPVEVTIHELALTSFEPPLFTFRTKCSSGTYVRTLAHDIGTALGCGAYLTALRRTTVGAFRIENATKIADITRENWETKILTD